MSDDALLWSDDDIAQASDELLERYVQLIAAGAGGAQYWKHAPSERQREFLALTCPEALYGGAAGGGKSDALLMAALQYVHKPRYTGILLRKTYRDLALPEALMDRADEWLRPWAAEGHCKWDGVEHQWIFSSSAKIIFGYLEGPNDKYRYQGAAFQFIGFDELTQFRETDYRYMFSRCRRTKGELEDIPLRVRAASNPGGIGHDWVKRRFIISESPNRKFVPAKLNDNPGLDADSYRQSLAELDPITRAQLEHGDWNIRPEGNMFKRDAVQIVSPGQVPEFTSVVRRWDFAATVLNEKKRNDPDWTVGLLLGRGRDGFLYVLDVVRGRWTPEHVEQQLKATAWRDGRKVATRWEEESGASGKFVSSSLRKLLEGFDARGIRSTGSKVERARPISARWDAGEVRIVDAPWTEEFLDEVTAFPEVAHDDQVDALSGAYQDISNVAHLSTDIVFGDDLGRASPNRI